MPEGWAWASLSEIANIYTGNSINENEKANKYSNLKEGLFYIATKDIDFEGKINYNNGIRIPLAESKFKIAPAESTLLCIEGGSAGRKIGFINQDVCFVNKLCCFHSDQLSNLYLFYYLQSRTFIDLFNANKSGLIGGVSLNLLKSIFIPVAPTIEQDLISKTIVTYLEKITSLNKDKETLELTIKKTKSKILDLAIHGKLVPQDSNDEPASVLLEKLRAEKEEKIAKGELKRDKNDSYIYKGSDNCYYEKFNGKDPVCIDEEIPFDIPKEWTWCRLSELAELKGGKRIPAGMSATKDKTDHIYIRVSDMKNDTITTDDLHYISDTIFEQIKQYIIGKDDLYLTIAGTIGRVGEVPELFDKMNLTENALKITNININKKYLLIVLKSPYVQDYFASTYHQVAMPKLSLTNASKTIIPLPPISEQKRIVSKIEEMFEQLDQIQNNLI